MTDKSVCCISNFQRYRLQCLFTLLQLCGHTLQWTTWLLLRAGTGRQAGAVRGPVGERVVGDPPCAGTTAGNGVCMPKPSGDWCACPPHSPPPYTHSSSQLPHTVPPHSPTTQLSPHSSHHSSPHTAPTHTPPTQPPNNSLHTAPSLNTAPSMHTAPLTQLIYAQVNAKPDEKEDTNSNVGIHNIAIGGTLG